MSLSKYYAVIFPQEKLNAFYTPNPCSPGTLGNAANVLVIGTSHQLILPFTTKLLGREEKYKWGKQYKYNIQGLSAVCQVIY